MVRILVLYDAAAPLGFRAGRRPEYPSRVEDDEMSKFDYDLFVIGAGSGGVRAGRVAAELGAKVAVAEEKRPGGTCVNLGCIPKKLLFYGSSFRDHFEYARSYGWHAGSPSFRWEELVRNKDREIRRLNEVYRDLLRRAGVDYVEGKAVLAGPHEVLVGSRRIRSRFVLVATGSRPWRPSVPGIEHTVTSDDVFSLPARPDTVLVVGGGYIAVEFAGIFHGCGARVILVHRRPLFLRGFDIDVRRTVATAMERKGIELRFETEVRRFDREGEKVRAELSDGTQVLADLVLCATGRVPATAGLGLERVGVELDGAGAVVVDEYSRSSVPSIYAVGDCTNRLNLTPVAIAEGDAVARTLFGPRPVRPDHANVPTAVFGNPPLACVGLTEEEARKRVGKVDVYRSTFRPLKHTLTGKDELALVKLVVDPVTDRVLGCHMVGEEAPEILQGFAVALRCGATKADFDETIGIHPTAAEEFVTLRAPVAPAQ
ncbi:MAG: glutathione reductase [Candidatus Binatia bacterium]|nr:MAG: glutathione reductase [Candidatus Binatia bacterium]